LSTAGAAWQGPDTILIVEADAALGEMAGDTMEALGYIVHRAANCREAISISGRLARLDLLVIDDGMPEMTGVELAQWLRALHPRMKVIFAETTADAPPDSLRKPYTVAALAARVREELAGESARRAAL
jgi:CheY-like chemotaxis protein